MAHELGEPLEPRELAAFVAAVESGSVHAAADALQLTQPATTRRIQSLERRLGVSLLERGRFGVRATDAGRLLYPEAKQALAVLQRAAEVLAAHTGHAPTLRLSASHTVGGFLLPGWLASFRALEHGALRPHVEIANSRAVLATVRDGQVDVGFIESREPTEGLQVQTIMRDEIVAVVAPGHPWASRRRIAARTLVSERYLTREPGSGTRAVAAAGLAVAGIELDPAFEAASTDSLKRAVLDGGFTLISRLAIEAEERAGTLCAVPVAGVDLTRPLRAVRRRRPAAVGVARRFWRWLEQAPAGGSEPAGAA